MHYEQPLSERMRTFLRLEFLYQQTLYNGERQADWATRATIATLLEILAILSRGDVRSDVHKELDHQLGVLERFQSKPGVDTGRLDSLIHNLATSRDELSRIGTAYLQPLKDCDFLNAVKHRSAIPGGTCEFDLPEYSHWLRQPYERGQTGHGQVSSSTIRPVSDAAADCFGSCGKVHDPTEKIAIEQYIPARTAEEISNCTDYCGSNLTGDDWLLPQIIDKPGASFRFHFLHSQRLTGRALQPRHDIPFKLSILLSLHLTGLRPPEHMSSSKLAGGPGCSHGTSAGFLTLSAHGLTVPVTLQEEFDHDHTMIVLHVATS